MKVKTPETWIANKKQKNIPPPPSCPLSHISYFKTFLHTVSLMWERNVYGMNSGHFLVQYLWVQNRSLLYFLK